MTEKYLRTVRSFVLRAGRMTAGQERAFEQVWPEFGLEIAQGAIDMQQLFGNTHPVILEIGFGMGDSLIAMAQARPEKNFIGIEVHRPGVGRLLSHIETLGLSNIRVYAEDAIEVLKLCIPNHSLDGLQLFFPDPWHKKKHHKRRIVQSNFAQLVAQKLDMGGVLHMATDWQPYAEHMLEIMKTETNYQNLAVNGDYSPQPEWRPNTKFQRRGERLGHGVWDLMFKKTG